MPTGRSCGGCGSYGTELSIYSVSYCTVRCAQLSHGPRRNAQRAPSKELGQKRDPRAFQHLVFTQPTSINSAGEITGSYCDTTSCAPHHASSWIETEISPHLMRRPDHSAYCLHLTIRAVRLRTIIQLERLRAPTLCPRQVSQSTVFCALGTALSRRLMRPAPLLPKSSLSTDRG